jgi:two-component system response regulator NreC
MSIRILLADDHRIMREGLRSILEKEAGMEVVAEAADGRSTVELARELSPDVVIMDISMGGLNGIDATRQITAGNDDVKVLALTMHSDEQFVAQMLAAGASGYLLKDCAAEELSRAVRAIAADAIYLSPRISGVLVNDYVSRLSRGDKSPSSALEVEERRIVKLVAEGKTSREIASCLQMSVRTVEACRRQIMAKLDIHTTAELTKYAVRQGLTGLESPEQTHGPGLPAR